MWKVLVILAGAAGVGGFFLPLVEHRDADGAVIMRTSAYQIVTHQTNTEAFGELAMGFGVSPEDAELLTERVEQGLIAYRTTLVAYYAPAALLALLGLINLLRGKMGRISGFLAVVLGAGNGLAFIIFFQTTKQQADPNVVLGWGVWLLAGAAGGAVFAGLGALIRPDDDYIELSQRRDVW